MGWYDIFANFYDRSLEPLYKEQRRLATQALELSQGCTVLDVPTGTGQSFDLIAPNVSLGSVLGVDLSQGMLNQAKARVAKHGWPNVHLLKADVQTLSPEAVQNEIGTPQVDRLHIFLGMSAFPNPEASFGNLWRLLKPGGVCVVVDVFSEKLGFQGRMVNLVARADITRRFWEPLEKLAVDYDRRPLPSLPDHGGTIFLARGRKSTLLDPHHESGV